MLMRGAPGAAAYLYYTRRGAENSSYSAVYGLHGFFPAVERGEKRSTQSRNSLKCLKKLRRARHGVRGRRICRLKEILMLFPIGF